MTAQRLDLLTGDIPLMANGVNSTAWMRWVHDLYLRVGGPTDKVDAAFVLASDAASGTTEVIGANGLRGGGTLNGNVAIELYAGFDTLANLPTKGLRNGDMAFCINGRKVGEGVGAGSGVPVYWSNANWTSFRTDATVTV